MGRFDKKINTDVMRKETMSLAYHHDRSCVQEAGCDKTVDCSCKSCIESIDPRPSKMVFRGIFIGLISALVGWLIVVAIIMIFT